MTRLPTISLLLLLLPPLFSGGQSIPWADVDGFAQNYVKKAKNAGVVVGVIRGETTEVRGYGRIDRNDARPPDGRTLFEIGGLSSVFTTSAVLLARRDYAFALGDPIQPYLTVKAPSYQPQRCVEIALPSRERIVTCSPDPLAESVCISFCDLADHTSGLTCSCEGGYEWNPFVTVSYKDPAFADISKEALYISLIDSKLETAPGSAFRYSNIGMALLGHLVADIAGRSYGELIEHYLTRPLGLVDTRPRPDEAQQARLAPGHDERGRAVPAWTFQAMAPAAGLRSTAADLLLFLRVNLGEGDTALDHAFEEARQPRLDVSFPGWKRPTSAGYGWLISRLDAGHNLPVAWINGGTGGYRAWMGLNRDTRTAVVVLANSALPVDDLAWQTLSVLLR